MLRVEIRSLPPVVTLGCIGRIVLGLEAETLRCMATSRLERHLVLDLRGVHCVDAAGLGLLVELHNWARERDRSLAVANPSPHVRRLMALTNLASVLNLAAEDARVVEDECEAMWA